MEQCLEKLLEFKRKIDNNESVDGPAMASRITECCPELGRQRFANCSSCKRQLINNLNTAIHILQNK